MSKAYMRKMGYSDGDTNIFPPTPDYEGGSETSIFKNKKPTNATDSVDDVKKKWTKKKKKKPQEAEEFPKRPM